MPDDGLVYRETLSTGSNIQIEIVVSSSTTIVAVRYVPMSLSGKKEVCAKETLTDGCVNARWSMLYEVHVACYQAVT